MELQTMISALSNGYRHPVPAQDTMQSNDEHRGEAWSRARIVHVSLPNDMNAVVAGRVRDILRKTDGVLDADVFEHHTLVVYDPVIICHHSVVEVLEGAGPEWTGRPEMLYSIALSGVLRRPYSSGGGRIYA